MTEIEYYKRMIKQKGMFIALVRNNERKRLIYGRRYCSIQRTADVCWFKMLQMITTREDFLFWKSAR